MDFKLIKTINDEMDAFRDKMLNCIQFDMIKRFIHNKQEFDIITKLYKAAIEAKSHYDSYYRIHDYMTVSDFQDLSKSEFGKKINKLNTLVKKHHRLYSESLSILKEFKDIYTCSNQTGRYGTKTKVNLGAMMPFKDFAQEDLFTSVIQRHGYTQTYVEMRDMRIYQVGSIEHEQEEIHVVGGKGVISVRISTSYGDFRGEAKTHPTDMVNGNSYYVKGFSIAYNRAKIKQLEYQIANDIEQIPTIVKKKK